MEEQYQLDHSLDDYVSKMKNYGVIVNDKLQPALFKLKNGLIYPGLLTNKQVNGHEQLVKVPINLLLTAHRAMKEPQLADVFANKFYKQGPVWQDRILITFLLYLLSTNKDSIWTYMASQFSKAIDILSFWPEEQFSNFVDQSAKKAAGKERAHFQDEWSRFQSIQEDYAILQDKKWFNRQNYKWIYIHTISRCFGSFLKSTYFVPFCELFNHHCVDVSYTCFDENKLKVQQKQVKGTNQQKEEKEDQESVSSGYSDDYLSDEDFDYMSINSYTIKWCSKISFDLKDKQTKIIDKQLKQIYSWMDQQLEWKGFTLLYLGQNIQRLKIYENQYKAGRQKFHSSTEKIQNIKLQLFAYRNHLIELYKSQGKEYQKVKNQRGVQNVHVKNVSWQNFQKTKQQCKETYTHFKMEARSQAFFKENTQIYFSYGKLSNRTLLIRYGFSLEDNPYEHVWIKFKLAKHVEPYPDLFDLMQSKGLSVSYKVKLKIYTFAIEPIVYFRVCNWKATHHKLEDIFFITDIDRQLQCLALAKQTYLQYLEKYAKIDSDLTDQSLGYHEYFVKVYNIEKKKILEKQLELLQYVGSLLNEIKNKKISPKQIQVKKEYSKYLKHYLKGLRGLSSF